MKYKYFSWRDFLKCTPACNESEMDETFMHKLDKARHIAGIPFKLNSAYRSVEWEKKKGRIGTSSHTKGIAVDIATDNSYDRLIIVKALILAGFTRIGIYETFIHVDADISKVNCLWLD